MTSTATPTRFTLDEDKVRRDLAEYLRIGFTAPLPAETPAHIKELDALNIDDGDVDFADPLAGPWRVIEWMGAESTSALDDVLNVAWEQGWLTGPADGRPDTDEFDWHVSFSFRLDGPWGSSPRLSTASEEYRKLVDKDPGNDEEFAAGADGILSFLRHVASYCNAELDSLDAYIAATPAQVRHQPTDVLTAAEFAAWVRHEVTAEAVFTEENNEDRTLADYVADLRTRLDRFLAGEVAW